MLLHISRVPFIMQRKDREGKPLPFSLKYVKKSTGEIIEIKDAVLTSSHHMGTVNIKILSSGQVRKLSLPLIIEFNNTKIHL